MTAWPLRVMLEHCNKPFWGLFNCSYCSWKMAMNLHEWMSVCVPVNFTSKNRKLVRTELAGCSLPSPTLEESSLFDLLFTMGLCLHFVKWNINGFVCYKWFLSKRNVIVFPLVEKVIPNVTVLLHHKTLTTLIFYIIILFQDSVFH